MARYFFNGRTKQFAKIIGNNAFTRRKNDEPWQDKGVIDTNLFFSRADQGYWPEVSAEEAGDRPYADCSKCAENWPELFDYHPDGYLVSKVTRSSVKPGDIIRGYKNTSKKGKAYPKIYVYGHGYQLSRIVYEMFNGPIPDGYYIENADNSCAKIEKLKLISRSESNLKSKINTTSGIKGVCWDKTRNKWTAQIEVNEISHRLGYFDNINDAINARINGGNQIPRQTNK